MLKPFLGLGAVRGEVGKHCGSEVVRHNRQIVFRLEGTGETVGGLQRLAPSRSPNLLEPVGEFNQHADRHGRFAQRVAADVLWNVVLHDPEIVLGDLGNEVAFVVHYGDVHASPSPLPC